MLMSTELAVGLITGAGVIISALFALRGQLAVAAVQRAQADAQRKQAEVAAQIQQEAADRATEAARVAAEAAITKARSEAKVGDAQAESVTVETMERAMKMLASRVLSLEESDSRKQKRIDDLYHESNTRAQRIDELETAVRALISQIDRLGHIPVYKLRETSVVLTEPESDGKNGSH
jgi:hypothetical protein